MSIPLASASPSAVGELALVVLAAGGGTRMRSILAKPLHLVAGLPMVTHVLRAGAAAEPATTVLVVGTATMDLASRLGVDAGVVTARQHPPRGTGDAVRLALPHVGDARWALVVFADHPLLDGATVRALVDGARSSGALATLLTCVVPQAAGYGRIARDAAGRVTGIVEHADDDPARRVGATEINSGMMVLDVAWAREAAERLVPSEASGEYYLTDLVGLAVGAVGSADERWPVASVAAPAEVALGVNDRLQLAAAEAVVRDRIRRRLMLAGVTLQGPETIFVDEDVQVGADTTLLPFTTLLAGTRIGDGCTVGPQATIERSTLGDGVLVRSSTLVGAVVADGADVGPYAHLRPGTVVGIGAHIGNYAELKNAEIGARAKIGHVSYVGDASVGEEANIGAGTIVANFDGRAKHRTEIGAGAFIGSDTVLRAPVRVGTRAITGAGSVVTRDVPDGATAVGVPARVIRWADVSESTARRGEIASGGRSEGEARGAAPAGDEPKGDA